LVNWSQRKNRKRIIIHKTNYVINILITGGSGLVGTRLTELLLQRGHGVAHLGRTKHDGSVKTFIWDVDHRQIEPEALQGIDAVVHLAGANIGDKPWTVERKREILESRTNSTRLLYDELKKGNHSIKTFVAASVIGYYGFEKPEEIFTEEDPPGNGFQALVAQRWEKEVDALRELGLRVVKIRTGVVLSEKGGALEELARPVKFYVGAPLGSGDQYMSWIHIDDNCRIFIKALEDEKMEGAYNGVAPDAITNRTLTTAIAKTIHKPLFLPPIPSFVLKLLLGEMADLVLLGSRVSPDKILQAGYEFKFTHIHDALNDLLQRK